MRRRRQRHVDLRRLAVRELASPQQRVERVVVRKAVADDSQSAAAPAATIAMGRRRVMRRERYLLTPPLLR